MKAKHKPLVMDHDDLIASLVDLCRRTDRTKVVAAFVVGLRANRLALRSPLGSYSFHLNHPQHELDAFDPSAGTANYLQCRICSFFSNTGRREVEIDLEYWANLRCTSTVENFHIPAYAFADLTLFADSEVPSATDADWDVMHHLLDHVRSLPSTANLPN